MAFKSISKYNEERYGGMFLLRNDGDSADVIFLYRSVEDVLVADTHYIKSADYSGYVSCNGRGCPACAKGIRVQTKLFIPLYNIESGELQFFDRSVRFEPQLQNDVFSKFPNPSEYVFRITRHGAAGDVNTTYSIVVVGKNTVLSYDDILKKFDTKFPDYFYNVCKDYSNGELALMLNTSADTSNSATADMPSYQITPRASRSVSDVPEPDLIIPTVDESAEETVSEDYDSLDEDPVF